jgi:hypothetical protein
MLTLKVMGEGVGGRGGERKNMEARFAAILVKSIVIGVVLSSFMYAIGVTASASFAPLPVTTTETALLIVGAVAPVAIGISEYMSAANPTGRTRFAAHIVKGIAIGLVLASFMYLVGVVATTAFVVLPTPTFETALLIIGQAAPVAIEISEYMASPREEPKQT